ncbi:MAG: LysR family transcriptional regulator [Spirochaetales bacterium]
MIKDINLDHLKIFYEVAKEQNLTKAAQKLYISQPAVTQTINKLEDGLNVKLFNRVKNGIVLTEVGERIFKAVNSGLLELQNIDKILDEDEALEYGSVTFGAGTNIAKKLLVEPIKNFLSKYPKITIQQIDGTQKNMLNKLELGQINFLITQKNDQVKNLEFKKLLDVEYIFVCGKEYLKNVSKKDDLVYISQDEDSFSRQTLNGFLTENNIVPKSLLEILGYNMQIELAINNLGIALVPDYLVSELIANKKLFKTNTDYTYPKMEYGYYVNPQNISAATKKFLEFLK